MADNEFNYSSFIEAVAGDGTSVPDLRHLQGYLGASGEEGRVRLYLDLELSCFLEIPADAILYSEEIADSRPAGAAAIWVRRDADIAEGGSALDRAAKFLSGSLRQDLGGAQGGAAGLAPGGAEGAAELQLPPSRLCLTFKPGCEPTGFTGNCQSNLIPCIPPSDFVACNFTRIPCSAVDACPTRIKVQCVTRPICGPVTRLNFCPVTRPQDCFPILTRPPACFPQVTRPALCDPAGGGNLDQAAAPPLTRLPCSAIDACPTRFNCPSVVTICQTRLDACPTRFDSCQTRLPDCPSVVTLCPTLDGSCPTQDATCPTRFDCPSVVTICPTQDGACPTQDATCPTRFDCPSVVTTCPSVFPEICPTQDATCPTRFDCPSVVTLCPTQDSSCPTQDATCPTRFDCPSVVTICPTLDGTCPTQDFSCPSAVTVCPSQIDACPTRLNCPSVVTVCPTRSDCPSRFDCPSVVTVCPSQIDACPTRLGCPTRFDCQTRFDCPSVATICPTDPTIVTADPRTAGRQARQPQARQGLAQQGGAARPPIPTVIPFLCNTRVPRLCPPTWICR